MLQYLRDLKEEAGCADCGGSFPHYVLEFDHVRGEKEFPISSFAARGWDRVLSELSKCDVVCANCHNVRSWNKGQWSDSTRYRDT
jgi:hypothetical protein